MAEEPRHGGVAAEGGAVDGDELAGKLSPAYGPGNTVTIDVVSSPLTEVFSGFGEKGRRAEDVAAQVAREDETYRSGAPVGSHLADQLLLWLALAGGGRFRTTAPTPHTTTHAEVIRTFLNVRVRCERIGDHAWVIAVDSFAESHP